MAVGEAVCDQAVAPAGTLTHHDGRPVDVVGALEVLALGRRLDTPHHSLDDAHAIERAFLHRDHLDRSFRAAHAWRVARRVPRAAAHDRRRDDVTS
eukprot:767258-Hanusia_phi.AAC.5